MLISSIVILIHFIVCNNKSVSFDFTINPKQTEFLSHLFLSFISITDFHVGTPSQKIQFQFEPGSYFDSLLIKSSKECTALPETAFDKEKSSSYYRKHNTSYLFASNKIILADLGIDTFQFNNTILPKRCFFMADKWGPEVNYSFIGLLPNFKKDYVSFIDHLSNQDIIDIRQFSIETFDQSYGRIVIGEDESIDNGKKAFDIKVLPNEKHRTPFYLTRRLVFDSNIIKEDFEVIMNESFGLVQFPIAMHEEIMRYYISKANCKSVIYDPPVRRMGKMLYTYFLCNREGLNSVKETLPSVVFEFSKGNLTLNKEDLFIEYDEDRVLFTIVLYDGGNNRFIIGNPILKNYKTVHNFDEKTLSLYYKQIINKHNHQGINQTKKLCILILAFAISIDLIVGVIIIIKQLLIK